MGLNDTTATKLSLKRLSGKAMTSDEKGVANEALPSNVVISAQTIFGNVIPPNPVASFYTITDGNAEYLRLSASFIAGSDTSSGRHAFSLQLPDDYEANSSNPKKGTYPFINKQSIPITSGSLQLIPTSFGNSYEALPYHTGSGQTQIPVLDARDWVLDYFSGIFFQQDPPGTGDQSTNPRYVDAYLYVGDFLVASTASSGGGSGDSAAEYLVLAATGSLSAERVLAMGTGLSSSDGGAGGNYTLSVRDSIFASLTGSQFSGNVGITGSFGATSNSIFGNNSSLSGVDNNFFVSGAIDSRGTSARGTSVFGGDIVASGAFVAQNGLSGSLTHLVDGSSYLIAGSNVTITTGSSGAVTIAASGAGSGDISGVIAGDGLSGGGLTGTVTLTTAPSSSIYFVTSSHGAGSELIVPSANFARNSYDFEKTQIFVNGNLMLSGSSFDYSLSGTSTGINFNFALRNDDIVIVKYL